MAADKRAGQVVPGVKLPRCVLLNLPDAVEFKDYCFIVTNAATNEIPVWSDGTNWKRFDTGATVT